MEKISIGKDQKESVYLLYTQDNILSWEKERGAMFF